jgi:hypothetical protein
MKNTTPGDNPSPQSFTEKMKELLENKDAYPDKPWLQRKDWTEGVIYDDVKGSLKARVNWIPIFVVFFFVFIYTFAVYKKDPSDTKGIIITLSIGGLLLIILLAQALIKILKNKKYSMSVFKLDATPVPVGGTLKGHMETKSFPIPKKGFVSILRCQHLSSYGSSAVIHYVTAWEHSCKIEQGQISDDGKILRIPVEFEIPDTCEGTISRYARVARFKEKKGDSIAILSTWKLREDKAYGVRWELALTAETPGVDFRTSFIVPVFELEQTETE